MLDPDGDRHGHSRGAAPRPRSRNRREHRRPRARVPHRSGRCARPHRDDDDEPRVPAGGLPEGSRHVGDPPARPGRGGRRHRPRVGAPVGSRHDVGRGQTAARRGQALMRLAARRVPMLVVGLVSMACGMWLGLVRLGWSLPLPWPDQLIAHGPLMVCGFLGTLISLERAVALGSRWGYVAAGALMLALGPLGAFGPLLITAGSLVMVAIFVAVWRRHASLFVATMTIG